MRSLSGWPVALSLGAFALSYAAAQDKPTGETIRSGLKDKIASIRVRGLFRF